VTLQEAVRTKLPFRRPQWKKGYYLQADGNGIVYTSEVTPSGVPMEWDRVFWKDLLATDWEFYNAPLTKERWRSF
jgi:catalase (peroxidase I)